MADWLVVLGGGTVKYEGTWADFPQDPKHDLEVHINETRDGTAEEQPQADETVQGQSLKVAEAISDLSRATGDVSLYGNIPRWLYKLLFVLTRLSCVGYYFRAMGVRNLLLLLACTSSYSFFVTFPQYWLQKWTEAPVSQTMFYVGGYLILSLMAWVSTNGSMW
ncbi:hypothetical protein IMZ48_33855 [Candidatus Bathyarchaeota archaeon]|nr:hypothetical protein [Candidatus Bathyarchaeota archaeon]